MMKKRWKLLFWR